ncbi:MAG: hypothetical protein IPI44_09815 [Sulfuritalea sp.]|nr:hypothetical protein [Sulfuritalea sp.]
MFGNWQDAMKFLARTKIGFRTHLKFNGGQPHPQPQERHMLAYPVTNHSVQGWNRDARLANQLRFKLFRDTGKQLRARIYHTPHHSPLPMGKLDQAAQLAVWQSIHGWLDEKTHGLQRLGARPMNMQNLWLAKLRVDPRPRRKSPALMRDPAGHEGGTVRALRQTLFRRAYRPPSRRPSSRVTTGPRPPTDHVWRRRR